MPIGDFRDFLLPAAVAAFGAVVAGIGWILKRRVQNESTKELLELHVKTLDLHQRLRAEGLTIEQLELIRRDLSRRGKNGLEIELKKREPRKFKSTEQLNAARLSELWRFVRDNPLQGVGGLLIILAGVISKFVA